MGFDFSLVDVFTDRPFGGNRLAVFPDATGIAGRDHAAAGLGVQPQRRPMTCSL
jgi:predicted PhzF superfamily epimerase YddE/YHI9